MYGHSLLWNNQIEKAIEEKNMNMIKRMMWYKWTFTLIVCLNFFPPRSTLENEYATQVKIHKSIRGNF